MQKNNLQLRLLPTIIGLVALPLTTCFAYSNVSTSPTSTISPFNKKIEYDGRWYRTTDQNKTPIMALSFGGTVKFKIKGTDHLSVTLDSVKGDQQHLTQYGYKLYQQGQKAPDHFTKFSQPDTGWGKQLVKIKAGLSKSRNYLFQMVRLTSSDSQETHLYGFSASQQASIQPFTNKKPLRVEIIGDSISEGYLADCAPKKTADQCKKDGTKDTNLAESFGPQLVSLLNQNNPTKYFTWSDIAVSGIGVTDKVHPPHADPIPDPKKAGNPYPEMDKIYPNENFAWKKYTKTYNGKHYTYPSPFAPIAWKFNDPKTHIDHRARLVIIELTTNDWEALLAHDNWNANLPVTPNEISATYKSLIQEVHKDNPQAIIYCLDVMNPFLLHLQDKKHPELHDNHLIQDLVNSYPQGATKYLRFLPTLHIPDSDFVPYASGPHHPDLHPTKAGHTDIARKIYRELKVDYLFRQLVSSQ